MGEIFKVELYNGPPPNPFPSVGSDPMQSLFTCLFFHPCVWAVFFFFFSFKYIQNAQLGSTKPGSQSSSPQVSAGSQLVWHLSYHPGAAGHVMCNLVLGE